MTRVTVVDPDGVQAWVPLTPFPAVSTVLCILDHVSHKKIQEIKFKSAKNLQTYCEDVACRLVMMQLT